MVTPLLHCRGGLASDSRGIDSHGGYRHGDLLQSLNRDTSRRAPAIRVPGPGYIMMFACPSHRYCPQACHGPCAPRYGRGLRLRKLAHQIDSEVTPTTPPTSSWTPSPYSLSESVMPQAPADSEHHDVFDKDASGSSLTPSQSVSDSLRL